VSQLNQNPITYSVELRFPGSAGWEPVGSPVAWGPGKAAERLAALREGLPGAEYRLVPCSPRPLVALKAVAR
jgi:hypothetical protein